MCDAKQGAVNERGRTAIVAAPARRPLATETSALAAVSTTAASALDSVLLRNAALAAAKRLVRPALGDVELLVDGRVDEILRAVLAREDFVALTRSRGVANLLDGLVLLQGRVLLVVVRCRNGLRGERGRGGGSGEWW